jgi:hypothetical protein
MYFPLEESTGRYYDGFLVFGNSGDVHIEIKTPRTFKGPSDLILLEGKLDPSYFYDYVEQNKFNTSKIYQRLKSNADSRAILATTVIDKYTKTYGKESLDDAKESFKQFEESLLSTIRGIMKDKQKQKMSVIAGGKED